MSEKPDMDVKNYSIEDLLKIMNVDLPMDQEELLEHGKDFINKYINEDPEAAAFFTNALKRLLENFKAVESFLNPTKNPEEQYAENTIENQYYNDGSVLQKVANTIPNRQNNVSIISENHSTQAQGRLISQNVHAPSLVQGNINPNLKNKYISWVNIDSHYREIRRKNESTSCDFNVIDPSGISIKILDSSTDYTFNLSEPLTNVTSLSLKSMEIPMNAYYPVSERYGTSSFDIVNLTSKEICCITLPSGFYPSFASGIWDTHSDIGGPTLVSQINHYLDNCGIADVRISISPNTQRTKFTNTSPDKYNIIFYSENGLDCSSEICRPNNSGARIDSNLGWLLGFRQPQYTLDISTLGNSIISESIVNPWGTRYLLLEVDDLNRNRTSGNLVSMSSNKDKLKLPEYYTKTRQIYPACSTDISGNPNALGIQHRQSATETPVEIKRPCRTGTPATTPLIDGNDNLTKAQKYTITEIINRRKTQDQSRYHSPVNTNILFRTPVNRDSTNVMTGNETAMIVSNDAVFDTARHYFGPVTIKTLKIKLLNDKGYPVELNNDWSFSLMAERLYQY